MLVGLITMKGAEDEKPELCIVPDKPSHLCEAVKVSRLTNTEFAVHLLSIEEGFTVEQNKHGSGILITAIKPAKLYLTPNRTDKPGFSVDVVKIIKELDNKYDVSFKREGREWTKWNPNERLY